MKNKIAKIFICFVLISSTLMFLPWIYLSPIYYITRYVLMALMAVTLILTFSLSDTFSARFVRLLSFTILLMLIIRIFLPIRLGDITQLIVALVVTTIGINIKFEEKDWRNLMFYYTFCISAVTICNCIVFAGNLKVPEYYMVNEGKNQIGAMLAIGSAACFYFGMKLKDQRVSFWSMAFLALLCIILIRARSDFFALLLFAIIIIIKDANLKFKPNFRNILTILVIIGSCVIVYTGFIGDEMHTFMYGGKNSTTINEITSRRWTRNIEGMEILRHTHIVEDINNTNPAYKIPFIHNYPLLRLVRYGIFSLPLLAFYLYFAISVIIEIFRNRRSEISQVGWLIFTIPLIISLAEPNFPYGPGFVQLPAFLLLGFSLKIIPLKLANSASRNNVLHVCNDFNNSKVHTNLYSELDKADISQTVFVPVRKNAPENNQFDAKNTNFVYAHILKPLHRLFFFHKIEKTVREVEKTVDLKNLSLIHATTLFSDGMVAYELYKKYGIPYIVAVRNSDINVFLRYMPHLWWCHRAVLNAAEKVVFITPSSKNRLLKHFTLFDLKQKIKQKSIIIPNGIDNYWIDNQKDKNNNPNLNIIYAGNFSKNKNTLRLVKAILKLKNAQNTHDIHLDLVGDGGSQKAEILKIANKYPENFTYHGRINDKVKMQEIYERNDIFAMPSKSETFGLVYIEALSQGLPVLWSNGEAIDGMFDYQVGESVNPRNVDDIAEKLSRIFTDYKSYQTLNKSDLEKFRWNAIANAYKSLYQDVFNKISQ